MTTGSGASSTTTYYTSTPHGPLSQVVARYEKSSVDNGGAPMFFDGGAIHWAVYGHGLLYEVVETINGSGKPVESEVLYYHTDQVGSTVAVTNQARQDVLWVQYDAHGAVTEAVSPTQRDGKPAVRPGLNQVADKLERALSVTPYLYCGEHGVMTDRTGLIHMRARYYHPGLRRFVNPDPIGFAGGMNWYGYASGGPVMAVDPSGNNPDAMYFATERLYEDANRHVGPPQFLAHFYGLGHKNGSISPMPTALPSYDEPTGLQMTDTPITPARRMGR